MSCTATSAACSACEGHERVHSVKSDMAGGMPMGPAFPIAFWAQVRGTSRIMLPS